MDNRAILKNIADNQELFEAVKKTVLDQFENMPYSERASDELLGQITRARYVGRQKVEEAFAEIARHKLIPKPEPKDNPAY